MPEGIVKQSKISQWGNSAAVRLPAVVLDQAHMSADDVVEIVARDDEIVIRHQRPRLTLDDLLSRYDPERHRHELMLDVPPVGKEIL